MGALPDLAWGSSEPEVLTSFALSLLLVFRTNSSYARWDEGRRRFGCISTTCRRAPAALARLILIRLVD